MKERSKFPKPRGWERRKIKDHKDPPASTDASGGPVTWPPPASQLRAPHYVQGSLAARVPESSEGGPCGLQAEVSWGSSCQGNSTSSSYFSLYSSRSSGSRVGGAASKDYLIRSTPRSSRPWNRPSAIPFVLCQPRSRKNGFFKGFLRPYG